MTARRPAAFTLPEILAAIAVVFVLAILALPALDAARMRGARAACLNNLRQIGVGIALYTADHDGRIPFGPKAGPYINPANFYPSTGAPTSLLSLQGGTPVALGLILAYLDDPRALFCPGSDQPVDATKELLKVGRHQAQGSYYYRHGGNTRLSDLPEMNYDPPYMRLANLGENRNGIPVRALVIDTIFLCPKSLESFNIRPRTHHRSRFANILFSDGHAVSRDNTDGRFTVDAQDVIQIRGTFDKILRVFEQADTEP